MILQDQTTLRWHNLLKDPNDLPKLQIPLKYLCVIALEENIVNENEVHGMAICEETYMPETKEWLGLFPKELDPQKDDIDPDILYRIHNTPITEQYYVYKKPAGKIIMWCDVYQELL